MHAQSDSATAAPDPTRAWAALSAATAEIITRLTSALAGTTATLDATSIATFVRGLYDSALVPLQDVDDARRVSITAGVSQANEIGWAYNDRLVETAAKAKAAGLSDDVIMHLVSHFAEFVPPPAPSGWLPPIDAFTRGLSIGGRIGEAAHAADADADPLDNPPAQPHGDDVTNSSH